MPRSSAIMAHALLERDPLRRSFETRHAMEYARQFAGGQVMHAIRLGTLVRPGQCSKCGGECVPEGHHEDYRKPLHVVWLCRTCHRGLHVELRRDIKSRVHNAVKPQHPGDNAGRAA